VLCQAGKNLTDLAGGLSFAKYYLWHSGTQGTVMVHFGEAEILEWKVT